MKNKTARHKSAELTDLGDLPDPSSSATNLKSHHTERSSEDETSSMEEPIMMENFNGVSASTELPGLESTSPTVPLTSAHVLRDVDRLIGHLDLDDEEETETPAATTPATAQREGADDDLFDPGNDGQWFVLFV